MERASGLTLTAEIAPSAVFSDGAKGVEPQYVEDEEFPLNLPLKYDWMLQPASRPNISSALGIITAVVAVLLILVSLFLVLNPSNASRSVLAAPRSSR